jgi:hypothetical protein
MPAEVLTEQIACDWLLDAASRVHRSLAIVEVGVYRGGSLKYLAHGALEGNEAPVYGIDPWGAPGAYPDRPHMLKRYVPSDQETAATQAPTAHLIRGFSVTEAARWSHGPIGLLYIDAVHRERDVLEDFYAWEPHLAPEAVVAFDDHDERFDGVRRAVARLVSEGRIAPIELIGNRLAVTTSRG